MKSEMRREILKMDMNPETPTTEKTGSRFSFIAILFSLLVALILWFYVQEAETPDYKKTFNDVSVEMQSLSSSFSVIEGGDNRVDITLVGKRSDLNKIKSSDLMAYLDLSNITQPGEYQTEIGVLVPEGTELFKCFPQSATMYIDQTVSVFVPLVVELGEYNVADDVVVDASPAVEGIQVKGPKGVLDQVECAKVKAGKLGDIRESFESNLSYTLLDKNGNEVVSRHLITPEKNVLVNFTVNKTKNVPMTLGTKNGWWAEEDMKYTISPKTILVKGEPAVIDALESVDVLVLDETKIDSSRFSKTLTPDKLELPEGIRLAETLGDIKVDLSLPSNGSKTLKMRLDSGHVAVTPPEKEGLTYTLEGTSLNFKIRGKYDHIYTAKVDDFYLNIDLSQITSVGTTEVPVQIVQTSATEGKYYPVGDYTVKVTIREASAGETPNN